MRTYGKTHPWLRFELDLRKAPANLWMMLGEIKSKCEHMAGVPLDSETADKLYQLYLARGAQATTAIEGNTLTEDEVKRRIEGTLKLPASSEYLGKEIDNIVLACNTMLANVVQGKSVDFTVDLIKGFNAMVLADLPVPENVVPGRIRTFFVGVGTYKAPPAEDCEFLVERLCSFLNRERKGMTRLDRLSTSVLLAIIAHLYVAWIHPFGDGNGRTARLMEFLLLLDGGVPTPAAHLLSNHYNQTRQAYYRELDRASSSGGDVIPILEYALQGFVDGLKGQLQEIRGYQLTMIWRDHVTRALEKGGGAESAAVRSRQRELVIALSDRRQPVPMQEIGLLTPLIARAYARKTPKTVSRDVNALKSLGLVEVGQAGVCARTESILAFLPPKKGD